MIVELTNHAKARLRERVGCKKSSMDKAAGRALESGLRRNEVSGSLGRYMDALYFYNRTANNIRLYNFTVYIFNGNTLITTLHLPQKHRNAYNAVMKRKREANPE